MRTAAGTAALLCTLITGCGIGAEDVGPDLAEKQTATLECLEEKGVRSAPGRGSDIQVGEPREGPLVRFYLTSGEAEATQFKGEVEGIEHIGSALLFVNQGSEDVLENVEECLAEL